MNKQIKNNTKFSFFLIAGLVAPIIVHVLRLTKYVVDLAVPYDTINTYLPLAKSLLKEGYAFFNDPISLSVAPGTYVYMALNQADINTIKTTNLALSLFILCVLFDIGRRVYGNLGAFFCVWLFVLSPTLDEISVYPQSEPLFLFFVICWIWCNAVFLSKDNEEIEIFVSKKYRYLSLIPASGLLLACATLTRGVYIYWIYSVIFLSSIFYFLKFKKIDFRQKSILKFIGVSNFISFFIVGLYILHNALTFNAPIIATGTGAALYYGNNTITSGSEPAYYGLHYDDWVVNTFENNSVSHLSINGDARLKSAAMLMLHDSSIVSLVSMYYEKLGATLFFSKSHLARHVINVRSWRIFLFITAILGIVSYWRNGFVLMVAGILFYQISVHLPVLYNPRYSTGSIEIYLIILSAFGLVKLFSKKVTILNAIKYTLLIIGAICYGAYRQWFDGEIMPHLDKNNYPATAIFSQHGLTYHGLNKNPFDQDARTLSDIAYIEWTNPSLEPESYAIVSLNVKKLDTSCKSIKVRHRSNWLEKIKNIDLSSRDYDSDITFGTRDLYIKKEINETSTMRFDFVCPLNSSINIDSISVHNGSVAMKYKSILYKNEKIN